MSKTITEDKTLLKRHQATPRQICTKIWENKQSVESIALEIWSKLVNILTGFLIQVVLVIPLPQTEKLHRNHQV